MREIRLSGSEGEPNPMGPPYPYHSDKTRHLPRSTTKNRTHFTSEGRL
jgi:hypothetical protein